MKLFSDFDVKETSHHLVVSHLDLHICDDIHAKEKGNKHCYLKLFWFSLKFTAHLDCFSYVISSLTLKITDHNFIIH